MESIVNLLIKYKSIIILVIVLTLGVYMVRNIKRFTRRLSDRLIGSITGKIIGTSLNSGDISRLVNDAKEISEEPNPKSVSGMTKTYLPKIQKDFVDFHNTEAVSAIKIFMNEFLDIKYGKKQQFEKSNVENGLELMINRENKKNIRNVDIHKVVISNYIKTNEYATITYQVAVGYNCDTRKEERYKIEYTMKLKEDGVASEAMVCEKCGAAIESTSIENCPYCDVRIIRDTRMSWQFTSIIKS